MLLEKLATANEIACSLNVKESTVRKWVHEGFIPHIKLGRALRFDTQDVIDWVKRRKQAGREERVPHITLV
jgi:excisionase family DNA binding protein